MLHREFHVGLLSAGLSFCCLVPGASAIDVEPGFVVDTLVNGQLDGVTPRLEAVRNPAFGAGVLSASIVNGILTVRRITPGNIEVVGSAVVPEDSVLDARFDTSGLFGGDLFICALSPQTTTMYRMASDGSISTVFTAGSGSDQLGFYVEFSDGTDGYPAGAYLLDINGINGSSLWFMEPDFDLVQIAQDTVPPGRSDIDVRGLEFDRSGGSAFGGRLLLAECDANQSQIGGVYVLENDNSWTSFSVNESTATRYLRDIAMSAGGALGSFAYLVEARDDVIEQIAPDGTIVEFASGFDFSAQYDDEPSGAASLSISDDGDEMFVADDSGIYRIRPVGDDPGPAVLAREPSTPSGVYRDPGGLPGARVIWSEPVAFDASDFVVVDEQGDPVGVNVQGSGSQFMLITFAVPLELDAYTITVLDTVSSSLNGAAIDGDADGLAGGNYEFTLVHRCPYDTDGDGDVDVDDLLGLLATWGSCT